MAGGTEYEPSLAIAGMAIERIKALHVSATPQNFEIWYNYASAVKPVLNQAINDLLSSRGTVTQDDLDELFERFFSPTRLSDQIGAFGTQVMGEIDQIMTVIDGALDSSSRHTESLVHMSSKIDDTTDLNALRGVIGKLVQTAKDIERTNQTFEAHLRESKLEITELQKHLEAVRSEIFTDPLTSLSNRKHFDQAITQAIVDSTAATTPLSLLMIDIDHFKKFNDTYGHLTGDQVLRLVAQSLKQNVKGRDLAARYGGEEFCVILPETSLQQATTVADHIRRAVAGRELVKRSTGESLGRVTISSGVAAMHPDDSPQSLIERADNCLYAAKRNGRNRVICEADPEFASPTQMKVA